MRVFYTEIFHGQIDNTEVFVDSAQMTALLGAAEKVQYQYVATGATGTSPTLVINRYKSNDNLNWSTASQLASVLLAGGSTTIAFALDAYAGDAPTAYIRIGLKVTGTGASAAVRLSACGRGEQEGM